jgi:hypothetical protein
LQHTCQNSILIIPTAGESVTVSIGQAGDLDYDLLDINPPQAVLTTSNYIAGVRIQLTPSATAKAKQGQDFYQLATLQHNILKFIFP